MNLLGNIWQANECHSSIKTLSIWAFYEIINTQNFELLLIKGKASEAELQAIWDDIYNEYFVEAEIKAPDWKAIMKLNQLVLKYNTLNRLIFIASKNDENFERACDALNKFRYTIRPDKPLDSEIKRLRTGLQALQTKIKIQSDSIEKPKKKAGLNIFRDVIKLKKHFKFEIDVKKTTCTEWIALNKELKEDIKNKKRAA